MFNDKVFIRTIAGLGVDSATAYLDTLVNKNKSLLYGFNNRSKNVGLTGQLFKTYYISRQLDRDAIGVETMNVADAKKVRDHLYSTYLTIEKPLKIVPIHFQNLDYDFVFDEFRKVDICATEKYLAKQFLIFFHKFALVAYDPFELNSAGKKDRVLFYNGQSAQNKVQSKITSLFERDLSVKVPLLVTYFAENGREEDDYEFFFKSYYLRFLKHVNHWRGFKTDEVIDADDYLFEESTKALDQLVQHYSECFTSEEYNAVKLYNTSKVFGNHEILESYAYTEKVEDLTHAEKMAWLMETCVPKYETFMESIGYNNG